MPLDVQKIKELREGLGLTPEEAAARAGFGGTRPGQSWRRIESGRRANVTMATLDAMARALDCSPRDLVADGDVGAKS
jgi:transcriptional regulator with XRE-family HTH domain